MRKKKKLEFKQGANRIPKYLSVKKSKFWEIIKYIIGFVVIIYATIGVINDDIYLCAKNGKGAHFHGTTVLILFFSALSIFVNLMSNIAYYNDNGDNDRYYVAIDKITKILGWTFFIAALVLDLFIFHTGRWD
jgi:O-antigen/teichoic acid export membrane protein